jgi:hypothetical protein
VVDRIAVDSGAGIEGVDIGGRRLSRTSQRVSRTSQRAGGYRRQLSFVEEVVWYAVAVVTYITAAIFEKGLLNWLVGPLWLVAVVTLGPVVVDRLRRR